MLVLQLRPTKGRGSRPADDPRGQANVAYLRVRPSDEETLIAVEVQYLIRSGAVALGFRADPAEVLIMRTLDDDGGKLEAWREGK